MNTAIDTDLLPPILQDMVELIGLRHTMKLVETFGGVRLYVPKRDTKPDHVLIVLVGEEATQKLVDNYGGETHDLPKAERALLAVRNGQIRTRRLHTSERTLALEYRLTSRQIRTICEEMVDDRQVGLF